MRECDSRGSCSLVSHDSSARQMNTSNSSVCVCARVCVCVELPSISFLLWHKSGSQGNILCVRVHLCNDCRAETMVNTLWILGYYYYYYSFCILMFLHFFGDRKTIVLHVLGQGSATITTQRAIWTFSHRKENNGRYNILWTFNGYMTPSINKLWHQPTTNWIWTFMFLTFLVNITKETLWSTPGVKGNPQTDGQTHTHTLCIFHSHREPQHKNQRTTCGSRAAGCQPVV